MVVFEVIGLRLGQVSVPSRLRPGVDGWTSLGHRRGCEPLQYKRDRPGMAEHRA